MKQGGRFVTIQEWMLQFGLTPSELIALALIFGFSQDGPSKYSGSYEYLRYWLNVSTNHTISSILKTLTEKGLVEKVETRVGAIKRCEYRIAPGLKILYATSAKNAPATSAKNALNKYNATLNKDREDNKGDLSLSKRSESEANPPQFTEKERAFFEAMLVERRDQAKNHQS